MLVIGPGANRRAARLKSVLADAPTMQAQLASATWVGGRAGGLEGFRQDEPDDQGATKARTDGGQPASSAPADAGSDGGT